MDTRSRVGLVAVLGVTLVVAACSGAAAPSSQSAGGAPSDIGSSAVDNTLGSAVAGGANGFEGQVTTSGLYAATWTVVQGMEAGPFNSASNPTLSSDKNTFGNIKVETDGSVSFGSAASELGKDTSFDGTGAQVTLDKSNAFVCAFTVDADLKASSGAILHMSGGMTVHWHPVGIGDLSCP